MSFNTSKIFTGGDYNAGERGGPAPRRLRQHVCPQQLKAWAEGKTTRSFRRYVKQFLHLKNA
jgi:hypothetical protein